MRAWFISLAAMFALASGAQAQEGQTQDVFAVWYTSYACPDSADLSQPGATRENPIAVDELLEIYYEAVPGDDYVYGEPREVSDFDCKWVRVTGFLTWFDYYHYRARLYENATSAYSRVDERFIVESFHDPEQRRSAVVQREVTLVGRFYDLCAAAQRRQAELQQRWLMIFGPCHYGAAEGMMLQDVTIESVRDEAPQYILGERNRRIFDQIYPATNEDRAAMIETTRRWAAAVRRGPSAFATESISLHDRLQAADAEDDRQEFREFHESTDSYVSYVHSLAAFRALNLDRAEVEVFGARAPRSGSGAIGCVCLVDSCSDQWPLTEADAANFVGAAVCTGLERDGDRWRWS